MILLTSYSQGKWVSLVRTKTCSKVKTAEIFSNKSSLNRKVGNILTRKYKKELLTT
jgi:hypothetical protein